ncbi:DUF2339 domain-containing protein, partial [Psychrobacter sp.]|uniref:DUF2339 domain-containing protein n=1 Tax=Psychrobacter sp. TaxID=56811 RepID=UPI0025D0A57F
NNKFIRLNQKISDLQNQLQELADQVQGDQDKSHRQVPDDEALTDSLIIEQSLEDANEHDSYESHDSLIISDTNYVQPTAPIATQTILSEDEHSIEGADQRSTKNASFATKPITKFLARNKATSTHLSSNKLSEPDEQSTPIVTSLLHSFKNWFFGGNLVVRVGAIVLLMGVVLLLRLLSEYIEVSIENKLITIGIIGLAIAGLGLKLIKNRFTYGITLQGAGLAIAYLAAFFAYQVYNVLPSLPSFLLLGILSGITVFLAVRQNAFPLALLAFSGAFLAPLLTSDNTGSLTTLFGYYLLLNVAIAVIAHYRTWKVLNLLAATVTFGFAYYLGLIDGVDSIDNLKAQRWPLVAIVALHWLLYVFVVIRYAQQLLQYNQHNQQVMNNQSDINTSSARPSYLLNKTQPYKDSNTAFIIPIDVSLMFGVPLLAFGLLSVLLNDINHALTIASALMSVIYLALGFYFLNKDKTDSKATNDIQALTHRHTLLIEGMLALGFGFFALMIAIAFDAQWTACGWAIQGLALVWFGRRTLRVWTILIGIVLQILAVASLLSVFKYYHAPTLSNLSLSLSAICSLASLFILRGENSPIHPSYNNVSSEQQLLGSTNTQSPIFRMLWSNPIFIQLLTFIATFWSLIATGIIIDDYFSQLFDNFLQYIIFVLLFNASVFYLIDRYRRWHNIQVISHVLMTLLYGCLLFSVYVLFEAHTGQLNLDINWPIFIVSVLGWLIVGQLWLQTWHKTNQSNLFDHMSWLATGAILIAELSYYLLPQSDGVMSILITSACLIALSYLCLIKKHFIPHWFNWQSALLGCALLFIPLSVMWAIYTNWTYDGIVWGLPYLPLINLYDLSLMAILVYLISTYYLATTTHNKSKTDLVSNKKGLNNLPNNIFGNLNLLLKIAGLLGFWMLSSLLIRTLHAYVGTPLWLDGAWHNEQVQTTLTICWTLTALVATIIASRYHKRFWWFMGIGLLGIVVLKLVLVDLSQTEAIWRVVSFIGAGSLILLIGYLAPLPPERDEKEAKIVATPDEDIS